MASNKIKLVTLYSKKGLFSSYNAYGQSSPPRVICRQWSVWDTKIVTLVRRICISSCGLLLKVHQRCTRKRGGGQVWPAEANVGWTRTTNHHHTRPYTSAAQLTPTPPFSPSLHGDHSKDWLSEKNHSNCHQHHQQVTMNSFSVFILRCCVFMFNCVFNLWSFLFYVQLWSASKMNFRCFPNGQ